MSPGAPFEGRKFRSRAPVLAGAGRGRPGRRDFSGGAALGGVTKDADRMSSLGENAKLMATSGPAQYIVISILCQ
jgi:hypothetical protein